MVLRPDKRVSVFIGTGATLRPAPPSEYGHSLLFSTVLKRSPRMIWGIPAVPTVRLRAWSRLCCLAVFDRDPPYSRRGTSPQSIPVNARSRPGGHSRAGLPPWPKPGGHTRHSRSPVSSPPLPPGSPAPAAIATDRPFPWKRAVAALSQVARLRTPATADMRTCRVPVFGGSTSALSGWTSQPGEYGHSIGVAGACRPGDSWCGAARATGSPVR